MCGDHKKFKNASVFSLLFEGIPIYYYGGEQFFNGGADPNNREVLWGHYDTSSEMYVALAAANKVRKKNRCGHKQSFRDMLMMCSMRSQEGTF